MNKVYIATIGFCLLQLALAAPVETNAIEKGSTPVSKNIEFQQIPDENVIAAIYRRATLQALSAKVQELQVKLTNGENPIPAAVEVLKIAIFSSPSQETIKKAAVRAFEMMPPDFKQLTGDVFIDGSTTPMPKIEEPKVISETPEDKEAVQEPKQES